LWLFIYDKRKREINKYPNPSISIKHLRGILSFIKSISLFWIALDSDFILLFSLLLELEDLKDGQFIFIIKI
jgi:hypothetical protein